VKRPSSQGNLGTVGNDGNRYPLVLIEWHDAYTGGNWSETWDAQPWLARTVGWLIHDGRDQKVVAQTSHDAAKDAFRTMNRLTIPSGCVKRIRRLK
jgi:hypothetical protein